MPGAYSVNSRKHPEFNNICAGSKGYRRDDTPIPRLMRRPLKRDRIKRAIRLKKSLTMT